MKQAGGKGKVGLWLMTYRTPLERVEGGGFRWSSGLMLDWQPRTFGWLLSYGLAGIGTVGIGWVSKRQRALDAATAGTPVEHPH